MAARLGGAAGASITSAGATACMPSGAQPRQSQAWQRYGRFMVNWRRKRSKAVRVFDLNTRGDPHEGQVFMGAPANR